MEGPRPAPRLAAAPCSRPASADGRIGRDRRRGRAPRSRTRRQFAEASPWPDPATAARHVYAPSQAGPSACVELTLHEGHPRGAWPRRWPGTRPSSCWARASARAAATSTPRPGLYDRYGPERLCDTPICERGFVGLAPGAAMTGRRPVVDFMFADFVLDARRRDRQPDRQDAVHEQRPAEDAGRAARLHRHRQLGGHAPLGQLLPDVRPLPRPPRRGALHAGRRQGPAQDRPPTSDDPVLFLEHRALLDLKGPVPDGEHFDPVRQGRGRPAGDATSRWWPWPSWSTRRCEAGEELAREGDLGRGDRPAHRGAAGHRDDPRLRAQDGPAADRRRGLRPVRHRRRDRGPGGRPRASTTSTPRSAA